MRATLMKKLRSFRHDEEGVTLVEYGIALVLAVTVGTDDTEEPFLLSPR